MRSLGVVIALLALVSVVTAEPNVADVDSLIWVSDQAASDSLASYWDHLSSSDWYEPLTQEDLGIGLTRARYDSLITAGDGVLVDMLRGRPWRFDVNWVNKFRFNRVEGVVFGGSVVVDRPGPRQPEWTTRVAYGFARHKPTVETALTVPLITTRRTDEYGRLMRRPWTGLALEIDAGDSVQRFSGERRFSASFVGLNHGHDPAHYYQRTWGRVGLRTRPTPWLSLWTGAARGEDQPMGVETRWSLQGGEDEVPDNLQIEPRTSTDFETGFTVRRHGLRFAADYKVSRTNQAWVRRFGASARAPRLDPLSNEWTLAGEWSSVDRRAPLQWKTWLGGLGTLRGYDPGELTGDHGGFVSVSAAWNVDLFRVLHVPLLKDWGLQPVTFGEIGMADDVAGLEPSYGLQGWRADAGFGFRRLMGLGSDGPSHLSLTAARPVGQHMGDRGWRVSMAMEFGR